MNKCVLVPEQKYKLLLKYSTECFRTSKADSSLEKEPVKGPSSALDTADTPPATVTQPDTQHPETETPRPAQLPPSPPANYTYLPATVPPVFRTLKRKKKRLPWISL